MAELNNQWVPDQDVTPLLMGNYLHSYFESARAHQTFVTTHPELISTRGSTKGKLKREYVLAEDMIAALKDDPQFKKLYRGKKEVMVTGKIGGVKWMGKLDCLRPDHAMLLDLKTTQELHKRYWLQDEQRWGSFLEAYNYPLQMAIYQELTYQRFGVRPRAVIIAVTKQNPPDKVAITIEQSVMDAAIERAIQNQARLEEVRKGLVAPKRCENCAYCRSTKQLQVIGLDDLIS